MAVPAKLVIYAKGTKPLCGPVPVKDMEINNLSGSEIQAFLHRVYTEKVKDHLYATFYGTDFIRKHDPLIITKPIDKLSMPICNYLINKTFLPKIEIRWYKYNEKSKNLEEYFRTTLENARITSQRITLPDVKDQLLEKYDQTEEVTFVYQRITWLYHKGYLLFTDEWNECYDELYLKDFSGKEEDPFAYLESMPVVEPLKIKFTNAQLVEPEKGFQIDKKVKAKYQAEFSREPTTQECKVFAKLYARYKGQTEDLRLIHEGWIYKDGTWSTEFKLEKPCLYEKDKNKKDDAVIEYFTEIENRYAERNFRSDLISVPVKKLKLEIKDMEGPEELVHNKSGTYTVKFNRKASDNERNKVSWVVRINGKETDRFENVGETLEFTPIGKYAGETVTVHPFLRSPSDSLCVKTTVGECLVFDGSKLLWLDKKHDEKEKWEAVTGKGDNTDPKKEGGPIPEGRWVVLQTKREIAEKDSWWENLINRKSANESSSKERIGLIPFTTTDTHKRDEEFYIHGSKEADTLPGINLGEDIDDFIDSFVNSGKNLVLVVRYIESNNEKNEIFYGGYKLKTGDNDKEKRWEGNIRDEEAKYVTELQKDLFKLGYWITDGLKVSGIGKAMVYDGCFGKGTYSGLKTLQYEHKDEYGLEVTGELDSKSAELIKKLINTPDFKRPGIPVEASSIPDGLFCVYANKKPSKPKKLFQLPPSPDHLYKRYGDPFYSTGGELGDVYHNDAWGTKEMIESLVELSKEWKGNGDVLEIGDISAWNCVNIGHASHRDGHSVDIRSSKVGAMVKHDSPNHLYDKEKTVEFAKKAIDKGFKYVITLCPHVTGECNKNDKNVLFLNQVDGHHNHLHMDYWISGSMVEEDHVEKSFCKKCHQKDICDSEYKYDETKDNI